jgi:hypothetical protein
MTLRGNQREGRTEACDHLASPCPPFINTLTAERLTTLTMPRGPRRWHEPPLRFMEMSGYGDPQRRPRLVTMTMRISDGALQIAGQRE